MKKLLLILLCLPMIGLGQGWEQTYGDPNGDEFGTRDLEELLLAFEMIKECKFEEENVEEFVHGVKGNRIQGGGAVYGFNRSHGDDDSSDDEGVY